MSKRKESLAGKLSRTTGLQLILVAGSLSFLSFSLGRQAEIQQREAHRAQVPAVQVSEQLSRKLSYPTIINELNEAAIAADPDLLQDFDRLSKRFWRQLNSFPVDYINYGGTDGSFLGLEKTKSGEVFHNEDSQRLGRGTMFVFNMSSDGLRLTQDDAIPGMSTSHEEAWYVDTIKAGEPTWSSIYSWEDQPETFSISYNAPIFDNNKQLLGVVGVDMIINQLSTWLQEAWKDKQGIAFIVEGNGDLVASSIPDITFAKGKESIQRANISELNHVLGEKIYNIYFRNKNTNPLKIESSSARTFFNEEDQYFTRITPWGKNYGLDWHLITAVLADQDLATAKRNQILFLAISITAILLALAINRRLIRALLHPLGALTQASLDTQNQIKEGVVKKNSATPLKYKCAPGASSTREVLDLNLAIQSMVEGFNRLTKTVRKKDEQALSAMSNKLKVSLEAASIAHEIKQPLSIVRLTSQSLIHTFSRSKNSPKPSEVISGLNTLTQETERISNIIEKMRSLLRNAQTRFEPINLNQVIENSVLYMKSNDQDGRWIDYTSLESISKLNPTINGDAIQLQLALINLLKNALEALRSEQVQDDLSKNPLIMVSLTSKDSTWIIDVEDNGPGISKSMFLEEPLNTSKPDGTGLGLFIVRSAAESHGGSLKLCSSPLGGLQARICLPSNLQS